LETAKPFAIPKMLVFEAYQAVKARKGAAGVDKESINYYSRFYPSAMYPIWQHFNYHLAQWTRRKYKRFARHKRRAREFVGRLALANQNLFVYWKKGIFQKA
jgi:hypothetical protein